MRIYKIIKTYRNARDVYYIESESAPSEDVLERIGEMTEGGHHYGYNVTAQAVRFLPKGKALLPREKTVVIY